MLVWSLIGLGFALVLVLIRLDSGPIALDWLKPRIERALTPDNGDAVVDAGGIELRLNQERRTLELVGVDVHYRIADAGDEPAVSFLTFPEVDIALSVEALLKRGMIAASEVLASAPSLIIMRNEDGIIGLYSEEDFQGGAADVDFGGLLRDFTLAPASGSRFAFLKKLQISGGRVAFYDRTRATALTAEEADLTLVRRDGGVDGWLRAQVPQRSAGHATLQLSGRIEAGADRVAVEADVVDLMPSDLPSLWPLQQPAVPAEAAGLRLPVRASIKGEIGLDGSLSPLEVEAQAADGVVDLPGYLAEPLSIDMGTLKGTLAADLDALDIDHAEIGSRGAALSGAGSLAWRSEERRLSLSLEASDVRAEDLPAFWPPAVGADARAWVIENIRAGRVGRGEVRLDLQPGDWGNAPLRDEALAGRFSFEGLSVRYVDEMPPLQRASGRAVFDADRMTFDVDGGRNAGVNLKAGSVTITGMGKPGRLATQLHVQAEAEGSIEQALAVLDHPPVEIAEELGISPSATAGSVNATIDVRMPLHDDVTEEESVVLAEASLTGLAIDGLPKLGSGVRLDSGAFGLVLDEEAVRLDGTAEINGVALAIDVFEPLEDETSKRRIGLRGRLGREQLESQGLALDGLDGEVGFEATVTETGSNFWIDLEADLEGLEIAPPGLVWRKPSGQEGKLHASIAVPVEGPIEVKQFDIGTGGLEASGWLSLTSGNDGLAALALDAFRLDETDAAIRLSPDGKGGYEVVVEGERLDLDALFGDDHEISKDFQRFRAILRIAELRARGIDMINVEADAVHTADGWRSASVIGALRKGGKLALELTPEGDDRRLQLRSENAGALIEALDLGQRIDGGSLLLSARMRSQDPALVDGRLEIERFTLEDAPLLARILTLASLTGIGNLLGGEGIRVDHLIMPFSLADRKLTFTDGLLRGSQLGLTLKGDVDLANEILDIAGTIIPVYSLNRLIGQVPIIGRILTGVDGRGAFAATYSIEGPRANPTVYVNPLSILTPGLIRDFFGGLINGTLEPPEERPTDD